MNKRFSTLLAAALVAGGLSFNANAAVTPVDASQIKDGSFIHLGTGSSLLVMKENSDCRLQQLGQAILINCSVHCGK